LVAVFTVLSSVDPAGVANFGQSPAQLAAATASELFAELDTDRSGFIDLAEFAAAYNAGDRKGAGADSFLPPSGGGGGGGGSSAASSGMSTDLVSRMLHLDRFEPDDVLDMLEECADEVDEGLGGCVALSRRAFARGCARLEALGHGERALAPVATMAAFTDALFDVLDLNGDGVMSLGELIAGLCVLMPGAAVDKCRAAFTAFDVNGDGYLSEPELTAFLNAVFTVMYRLGSYTAVVPPKVLAAITAKQSFAERGSRAGVRGMTWPQFENWFHLAGV